jgi:hypothetical protein
MNFFEGSRVWEYFLYSAMLGSLIFWYFDKKIVKDEREEMIRLKALELTSKIQGWTIFGVVVYMDLFSSITSKRLIVIMLILSFYVEIFGKLYYRRKY